MTHANPIFLGILAVAAVLAGSISSIAGFGIGSVLTPLAALDVGLKDAVVLVAIPHFLATCARFWLLREYTDRRVLWSFGLMNAAGALAGAVLHGSESNALLAYILAALLLLAGSGSLFGFTHGLHFGRGAAWAAGAVSGAFGGLVGNQGGLRSAAMLALGIKREAFVATAAAIALMVDVVRVPVYLAHGGVSLDGRATLVIVITAGALFGTFFGAHMLRRIPERLFRRIVGGVLCAMALFVFFQPHS